MSVNEFKPVNDIYLTDYSGNRVAITESGAMHVKQLIGSGYNAMYLTNESGNISVTVNPGLLGDGLTQGTQNTLNVGASLYGFDGSTINRVRVSVSGSIASSSGTTFRLLTDEVNVGEKLRAGFTLATSGSGGVQLTNSGGLAPYGIKIKNLGVGASGATGAIYVGSSGTPPFISGGYMLFQQQESEFKINNPSLVRVYGTFSGVVVSWCSMDY